MRFNNIKFNYDNYDTENRLVSVTGAATANFYYDADGKQVKSIVGGVTTYYVGQHYEKKGTTVTKYYFAGATRIAVRTNGTLFFLLADHLGSSSVTTDANGVKSAHLKNNRPRFPSLGRSSLLKILRVLRGKKTA